MPSVREIHGQDAISRLQRAEVNSHVRLTTAVRLHVDMFRSEKLFSPVDRQLFRDVYVLATTVPSASGVTFGILVGQNRALSFHYSSAREIFRCYQFDIFKLALPFAFDRLEDGRIDLFQAEISGLVLRHGVGIE